MPLLHLDLTCSCATFSHSASHYHYQPSNAAFLLFYGSLFLLQPWVHLCRRGKHLYTRLGMCHSYHAKTLVWILYSYVSLSPLLVCWIFCNKLWFSCVCTMPVAILYGNCMGSCVLLSISLVHTTHFIHILILVNTLRIFSAFSWIFHNHSLCCMSFPPPPAWVPTAMDLYLLPSSPCHLPHYLGADPCLSSSSPLQVLMTLLNSLSTIGVCTPPMLLSILLTATTTASVHAPAGAEEGCTLQILPKRSRVPANILFGKHGLITA